MPSETPNTIIPLLGEPLMAKMLRVKVMDLEGAVVYVGFGSCAQENGMMVDEVCASINVCKHCDNFVLSVVSIDVKKVGWDNVEVPGIPV